MTEKMTKMQEYQKDYREKNQDKLRAYQKKYSGRRVWVTKAPE